MTGRRSCWVLAVMLAQAVAGGGFLAQILYPGGAVYIDPLRQDDTAHYVSFHQRDQRTDSRGWECLTGSEHDPDPDPAPVRSRPAPGAGEALATGEMLRT